MDPITGEALAIIEKTVEKTFLGLTKKEQNGVFICAGIVLICIGVFRN